MKNLIRMLNIIKETEKKFIPHLLLLGISGALIPLANIIIPKLLIDELLSGKNLTRLIIYVVILILAYFISSYVYEREKMTLDLVITEIHRISNMNLVIHSNKFPLSILESKTNQDELEMAEFGLFHLYFVIDIIPEILKSIITGVFAFFILSTINIILPLFILISSLILIPIYKKIRDIEVDNAKRSAPENRKFNFFSQFAMDFRYAKDIRIFEGKELILSKAKEDMDKILRINHSYFTKSGHYQGIQGIVSEIQTGAIFLYTLSKLLNGAMSAGDFIMCFNASRQMGEAFKIVMMKYSSIVTTNLMLKSYFDYIDKNEDIKANIEANIEKTNSKFEDSFHNKFSEDVSITFNKVSFKYPGSEKMVLDDCSFEISSGQRVALVGKNASGKSTIIKLICRFYEPNSGTIHINGKDISKIPLSEYYKLLSITFQNFRVFPFKISENISCKPEFMHDGKDGINIRQSLEKVNLTQWIDGLDKKVSTFYSDILSEEGIISSGGQAQKIALARSLFHNGRFIIMDEPTAALDPRSEEEIFKEMMEMTEKMTSLFISHRLSSTRYADKILVCSNGKIEETGTHQELMEKNGLYSKMYRTQATQYS